MTDAERGAEEDVAALVAQEPEGVSEEANMQASSQGQEQQQVAAEVEIPDYWVPGEDEMGLLQMVASLPEGNSVYLHARPTEELRANASDYAGEWIDLFDDLLVKGKSQVLRQETASVPDTAIYTAQTVHQHIRNASQKDYLPVKYRDWSRWAVAHYPLDAKGGFGCLKESPSAMIPVILNPFRRSFVDRYFLVCINSGPGYFIPISKTQFVVAGIHTNENRLRGKQYLSHEQFQALQNIPDADEGVVSLQWAPTLRVAEWVPSQKAFFASALLLAVVEAAFGPSMRAETGTPALRRDASNASPVSIASLWERVKGVGRVSLWMAVGFASSTSGRILATRSEEAFVTAETPFTALASGVVALTSESASTLWVFNALSMLANYRCALLVC